MSARRCEVWVSSAGTAPRRVESRNSASLRVEPSSWAVVSATPVLAFPLVRSGVNATPAARSANSGVDAKITSAPCSASERASTDSGWACERNGGLTTTTRGTGVSHFLDVRSNSIQIRSRGGPRFERGACGHIRKCFVAWKTVGAA